MIQDPVKYGEGWYGTPKGPERTRSIRDSKILAEDASEREGGYRKGVDGLGTFEV